MNDYFDQLTGPKGYITRHELLDAGFTDDHIAQARRANSIVRIRHGAYAAASVWIGLRPEERHRLLTHVVADRLGNSVAITHSSAATEYGLDLYDTDLSTVHVTRLDGHTGRTEAGVTHHSGLVLPADDLAEINGRLYVKPARAVAETCLISSVESGMVLASSALHANVVTSPELVEITGRFTNWRGARRARLACQLANSKCESVGETRSLYMAWRWGLPAPTLQYEVRDRRGQLLGRADFGWLDHCHLGEFDGMIKYGRLNPYSDDPGRAISDEKVREDLMRGQGFGMSRWTWFDLSAAQQRHTSERIRAALEQSRRLYQRNAVTIPLR